MEEGDATSQKVIDTRICPSRNPQAKPFCSGLAFTTVIFPDRFCEVTSCNPHFSGRTTFIKSVGKGSLRSIAPGATGGG